MPSMNIYKKKAEIEEEEKKLCFFPLQVFASSWWLPLKWSVELVSQAEVRHVG